MNFLRNRLLRRFTVLGRLADLALVAGMLVRLARRMGWIDSDESNVGFNEDGDPEPKKLAVVELALAGAALGRLVRRRKQKP